MSDTSAKTALDRAKNKPKTGEKSTPNNANAQNRGVSIRSGK